MQDPQSAPGSRVGKRAGGNGRSGIPLEPVDRSHLLKRSNPFPFPLPHSNGLVRIRRERRVCESFSGIRSLARRGEQGHR
ncbi:MAG: hypothetical protein ACN0LA_03165 [Candidatus Longimicrobiales bacterium M2_2A_002]